ncbi:thioredoxin [Pseudohyphozyma bogoriensis]|nr:thioredoxin [Pseudohyphozyma bogoriensis]
MPVNTIETSAQYKDIISSDGLHAIEFCAPWEEPCSKTISPRFDSYSTSPKYSNVKFHRVDICESQDVAMDSGVSFAPAFHFYKDGKKEKEYVGSSYPALERTLGSFSA